MKNTHHVGAIALALIVAGGAISETGAQHRGRANVRALQVDENADGLSDGQVLLPLLVFDAELHQEVLPSDVATDLTALLLGLLRRPRHCATHQFRCA